MGSEVQDREFARSVATRNAWGDRAASVARRGEPACAFPEHRDRDWRRDGGPWVCGICHPCPFDWSDPIEWRNELERQALESQHRDALEGGWE